MIENGAQQKEAAPKSLASSNCHIITLKTQKIDFSALATEWCWVRRTDQSLAALSRNCWRSFASKICRAQALANCKIFDDSDKYLRTNRWAIGPV